MTTRNAREELIAQAEARRLSLCLDHQDKQRGKACLACRIEELKAACRQARACLLNLQPDDGGPMARQMQKMIDELTKAIEEER